MHITAFGLFGGLLIYAVVWRLWFAPRKARRLQASVTAQRLSHEARLKGLKEIDISALEAWIQKR